MSPRADQPVKIKRDTPSPFARVARPGRRLRSTIAGRTLLGLLGFFGAMLISIWQHHPPSAPLPAATRSSTSFEVVGVQALGIIGLMSFLVGIVIAQQGAVQLRQFGAEIYTINLIGRSRCKELGVLMTAIMVAGRSGSAFAAQIGSMKLTEEVDAMRTIGVSPMEALVIPRVLATVLLMPLLGFYAAMIAIIGGGMFCWLSLDIPPVTFIQRIREVVPMTDLWSDADQGAGVRHDHRHGRLLPGHAGRRAMPRRSASAPPPRWSRAIFLVIVLDAFFAVFFTEIGWTDERRPETRSSRCAG